MKIIRQQEDRTHLHSKKFLCFNLDLTFRFALFTNELIALAYQNQTVKCPTQGIQNVIDSLMSELLDTCSKSYKKKYFI